MGDPEDFGYFYLVFVRRKLNKSGVISIQVILKQNGKQKLIKTIGSSSDPSEVERLFQAGNVFMQGYEGQQYLNFNETSKDIKSAFESISSHKEVGTDLLLGKIFDQIGFNQIKDLLFKKLVLARLTNPSSKLSTSDYLVRYKELEIPIQQIYRYMDKLQSTQKELVQDISFRHTLSLFKNQIQIVFYDVTTLYFEIDREDELRKTGFSKEGKHQNPQILLGLLVSKDGYPLAYDIFEGNKFEGQTMLPILDSFKDKYQLEKLIVIADSGLLSNSNIEALQEKGYEFILGARIKNEKQIIQKNILALKLSNGQSSLLLKGDLKLIITYSDARAKKDRLNREKGLAKLEKQIRTGRLTKSNINNRGYNKYLKLEGNILIQIDHEKFNDDRKWDGLKGYLTNTNLSKDEIILNYQQLWQIEKAFRITKTDIKIRPIYHRLERRIQAHICIAFVAYKIYKELERLLKEKKSSLSPEKAIEIAKSIYQIETGNVNDNQSIKHILLLKEERRKLASMFDFQFG